MKVSGWEQRGHISGRVEERGDGIVIFIKKKDGRESNILNLVAVIYIQDRSIKNSSYFAINLGYSTFVAFISFSWSALNFTSHRSSGVTTMLNFLPKT